ncbi:1-(5-phosphoribosyl)-5-[(5-phosphoribosylamino)methylideneamino]imidazole-4-carboxamide isomerase [Sedimentisphaera salicampi]|uniref:1-(5-phosphoribosyl)-5-[(5-phosphoribosylamino)methylideneamino] imidazole-4-carboxamide isomerase n=1 Tax=Sedimentisphaera salicampi TaxID=1941349 RepID=A0A1W6LJP6_9BACT|nr:1-(5-phosphoribosyl)-5-[(5-phosphoribosylamino)methylideneamino]imidazole-4-carboxamide isomerase [Sedimentisphaera salicampi]ARN56018.1 1-(5-phosphoribosyl)-5-[(5- phosphoribosylamino)methylideneamino] imidazole-4-carboxamide isomerase [Sedimentisphaera salicampi]OXU15931.1 1-(5-phosphoribosyl)-5-[(5-phosphoribosylamino)methylideneamino] imidazole-4-carboxamide isomerase [Sedimentisphaera salicampi]
MDVLPAIDLIDGKCVRLVQGDYEKKITYKDDPSDQAKDFAKAGAKWIHLIDLDGAKQGKPVNLKTVKKIAKGRLNVEFGGGVRNEDSIKILLDAGVSRIIIGTRAIREFDWFTQMAEKYPDKLVLGLDARGDKIATHGWLENTDLELIEFARKASALPINSIIYTDISKDGTLEGPNLERTSNLVKSVDSSVIAAGGVTCVDDITKLGEAGVAGAVIGRALYEGTITLKGAIEAAGNKG